jgi:4-hydroxy-tetrahydrodipicolinate synthase
MIPDGSPSPFGPVLTAMITPFDADGAVDYGQTWELARFLVTHGSDGIVVAGTTGESPSGPR